MFTLVHFLLKKRYRSPLKKIPEGYNPPHIGGLSYSGGIQPPLDGYPQIIET